MVVVGLGYFYIKKNSNIKFNYTVLEIPSLVKNYLKELVSLILF